MRLRPFQLLSLALLMVVASIVSDLACPTRAFAQSSSRDSRSEGEGRDRSRRDRGGDSRSRRDDDRRGDERSSSSSGSTSTTSTESKPASSSSSSSTSASLSTAEYAKSFIRGKDKDKNGYLNGEELKDLTGKPAEADLNKDGGITVEELTARLSSDPPPTTNTSNGSTSASSKSDSDRKKEDTDLSKRVLYGTVYGAIANAKETDKRHTYRFSKASDRLPSGLPGWFKSKDANNDGQVSMSEYSRSWSKSTVSEFRKYDLNDDGIVTAKEVAKPENKGG